MTRWRNGDTSLSKACEDLRTPLRPSSGGVPDLGTLKACGPSNVLSVCRGSATATSAAGPAPGFTPSTAPAGMRYLSCSTRGMAATRATTCTGLKYCPWSRKRVSSSESYVAFASSTDSCRGLVKRPPAVRGAARNVVEGVGRGSRRRYWRLCLVVAKASSDRAASCEGGVGHSLEFHLRCLIVLLDFRSYLY